MREYELIRIDQDTWSIEDDFVRFFLLKGTDKTILIDSGADMKHVKALARAIFAESAAGGKLESVAAGEAAKLSEEEILKYQNEDAGAALPLELLNTHADGDHCFGNKEFDWFYMHEEDRTHYEKQYGKEANIVSVKDGEVIDLGERPLEIIHIPGHTHGSIAILDINKRALFSGDSVQDGGIFMFGDHRNLDEYPASLMKLQELEEKFDVVYASHASLSLDPEAVGECFDACESVLHGEVEPEQRDVHGFLINAYDCGVCTFLIDLDRKFSTQ